MSSTSDQNQEPVQSTSNTDADTASVSPAGSPPAMNTSQDYTRNQYLIIQELNDSLLRSCSHGVPYTRNCIKCLFGYIGV